MIKRGRLDAQNRWTVPLSLFASFLVNDGEELMTMADGPAPWSFLLHPTDAHGTLDQRHVNVAVGWMSLLLGAAVVDGIRSRGRGPLYQDVQMVFGAHGIIHLANSLRSRDYTTGVATAPLVLAQWRWAAKRLKDAGVPTVAEPRRGVALMGTWLLTSHVLGAAASAAASRAPRRRRSF
ncbi:HXXEE domain-containing protein [Micrococcus luteus]|uniref:HXXEE domain-containing protein n=1 Tax=Micrococcus luteus TaxID=1270 RepID=UPI0038790933